jgi:Rod binding domain-containing protein
MANGITLPPPGLSALDALNSAGKNAKLAGLAQKKAKSTAEDFEAVFLNSMFQQMFTGISGEGPFGGSGGAGVWRSFLTDEYSKSFAKAGGIGLSDAVYRELLAKQGQHAR